MRDFGQWMVGIADMMGNFDRKDKDEEFYENPPKDVVELTVAIRNHMDKEDVIEAMLNESVGHSILDSGGTDGRSYQQNRQKPHHKHAAATVINTYRYEKKVNPPEHYDHVPKHGRGEMTLDDEAEYRQLSYELAVADAEEHPYRWELMITHHVGPWMMAHLGDVSYEMTNDFIGWVHNETEDGDEYVNSTDSVEAYLKERYDQEPANGDLEIMGSDNTYNGESAISQTIQYLQFALDSTPYIAICLHGGADVRGGYGTAVIFEEDGDYGESPMYDVARLSLYDDATGATWDSYNCGYDWDSHNGPQRDLPLSSLRSIGVITRRDLLEKTIRGSKEKPRTWKTTEPAIGWASPPQWILDRVDKGELQWREIKTKDAYYHEYESGLVIDRPAEYAWALELPWGILWPDSLVTEYQFNWWEKQESRGWWGEELDRHTQEGEYQHEQYALRQFLPSEGDYDDFNKIDMMGDVIDEDIELFWSIYLPGKYRLLPRKISNRYWRFRMWLRGNDVSLIHKLKPEHNLIDEDNDKVFSPYYPFEELQGGW